MKCTHCKNGLLTLSRNFKFLRVHFNQCKTLRATPTRGPTPKRSPEHCWEQSTRHYWVWPENHFKRKWESKNTPTEIMTQWVMRSQCCESSHLFLPTSQRRKGWCEKLAEMKVVRQEQAGHDDKLVCLGTPQDKR